MSSNLITPHDWRRRKTRWALGSIEALLLVGLLVFGLGPILWLAKAAITPTNDTLTHPLGLFPNGAAWGNLEEAWSTVHVGRYFWNTVVLAFGSWLVQIVVATTGAAIVSSCCTGRNTPTSSSTSRAATAS